ncbi:MAG: hypothetical protein AAFX87_16680 [Bacteroidota bacterium]
MSEKELMAVLIGLGLLAVFALPIIYLVRHKMKIKRVWAAFASQNSLTHEEGRYPVVFGGIDGRVFEMGSAIGRNPASGRASNQQLVEFYGWAEIFGNVPNGFIAGKKGALQGKGPIQTDSDQFNRKVWADSVDKEAGKVYLTPERQEALLALVKYDGLVYGPQGDAPPIVTLSRSGYKVRLEWLEERKDVILKTAKAFDN